MSTLCRRPRAEERRRPARADPDPDDPAAGHLRSQRSGSASAMDWWAIISNTLRGRHQRRARSSTPSPPSGSTCTSATPACSTSARSAFMAAGAYGLGITTYTYGWPLWAGILAGLGAGVLLGAAARRPDAATARRLPGHRHHRRRRDHPHHRARGGAARHHRWLERHQRLRQRVPGVEPAATRRPSTAGSCSASSTSSTPAPTCGS